MTEEIKLDENKDIIEEKIGDYTIKHNVQQLKDNVSKLDDDIEKYYALASSQTYEII